MGGNLINILSKLWVAEKKKKKLIVLVFKKRSVHLLEFLWKEGFIYGYRKKNLKLIIFLKYFHRGLGFFSSLVFTKVKKISTKKIKSLSLLNKNSVYLILTSKGLFSNNKCLKLNISGYLLCRL